MPLPSPRRHHSTRTHRPHARYHAIRRPGAPAPGGVAAALMAAAALAEAAGARVVILAAVPAPRLVMAPPTAAPAGPAATPLERARADLRALDLDIQFAPDTHARARLEMDRLDLAARVAALTERRTGGPAR